MRNSKLYRFFEIIPGALIWATLLGALGLSLIKPLWALYLVIAFDLYWLFRVVYFVIYLMMSWRKYRATVRVDWLKTLHDNGLDWEKLYHLVLLPTYKESLEVLTTTLKGLAATHYPKDKFIVVLAGEERDRENFLANVQVLRREFGQEFGNFWVTLHPKDLLGEIPGKGSNLNYAGHQVKILIDAKKIPYENIIVSAFDSDTVPHPQYFAHLSYLYLTVPDPMRTSYQPIAFYHNNLWEAPAFLRLGALSTTFWNMTELARPERLWTFSSHSMPWCALVDVGFWQKDVVNEDTRILLQCLVRYSGHYRVTPLYLPVSMDTVNTNSYIKSHVALYKQQRRWAWGGAEHIPFLAAHFFREHKTPKLKKAKWIWLVLEGMHSWATASLMIIILGQVPFLVGERALGASVIYQYAPRILAWLMNLSLIGMLASIFITIRLLPPMPKGVPRWRKAGMFLQWLLLPVSLIIFSALPAIEAQTRLMLGKYLGFNVTEKVRKTQSQFKLAASSV